MQIYFHSRLCSYLSRVPILVEGTVANKSEFRKGADAGVKLNVLLVLSSSISYSFLFCKTETYEDCKCLVTESSQLNVNEFTLFTMLSEHT